MISRLSLVGAILSLLLTPATVILWIRSYSHIDQISFARSSQLWEVRSQRGRFFIDNEPQREIDRLPQTMIARKLQRLQLVEGETARQVKPAMDEWLHQRGRFAQGAVDDGSKAQLDKLVLEHSAQKDEIWNLQQLKYASMWQFPVSPWECNFSSVN